MNVKTNHILKRTISSLVIGMGLFLVSAADASPDRVEYRPYAVHDNYVYGRARAFPGWLHGDREFQRWYSNSHYRSMGHMSWPSLYDNYLIERRYRTHGRRFFGNAYRDNGHRTYRRKSRRH